jgi:hypothetical protein
MVACPRCGRSNEGKYRFCLGCGAVLPATDARPPSAATALPQEPVAAPPAVRPAAPPPPAAVPPSVLHAPPPIAPVPSKLARPTTPPGTPGKGSLAPTAHAADMPAPGSIGPPPSARLAGRGEPKRPSRTVGDSGPAARSPAPEPPASALADPSEGATLGIPPVTDEDVAAAQSAAVGLEGGTIRRVPRPAARPAEVPAPAVPLPPAPRPGSSAARPVPPPSSAHLQSSPRRQSNPVIHMAPAARQPAPAAPPVPDCEHCGAPVPFSNSFCGACGQPNQHHTPTIPMPQAALKAESVGSLALIDDNGAESIQFPLIAGENRIGSGKTCQLRFPDDGFLANLHCAVDAGPDKCSLRPVDDCNGVYLRITTPVEVHHGDVMRVGQEVLRFERLDRLQPEIGLDGQLEAVGWPVPRGVWGRLCQVGLQRQVANAYLLANPDVFLGRERGDILFPKDGFVSGSHAVLSDRNGRAFLKDLGSSNGTFIRVKQQTPLRNGDLFLLGRNLLRVHIGGA